MEMTIVLITNIVLTIIAIYIVVVLFVRAQRRNEKKRSNELVESTITEKSFMDILEYRRLKSESGNSLMLYSVDISAIGLIDRYISKEGNEIKDEMVYRLNSLLKEYAFITLKEDYIIIQDKLEKNTCAITEQLDRMVKELNKPYLIDGKEYNIKTYIGCLPVEGSQEQMENIFKKLMNVTKKTKALGEKYFIYTNKDEEKPITYLEIEKGMEKREFRLVYQPQKDISTGKVIGVEGLVRWAHGKRGNIRPDQFIQIAERTGLIQELGYHIMVMALQDYKKWNKPDFIVSINVSLGQFSDKNMVENIRRIVEREGVEPKNIKLEITETVGIEDIGSIKATLIELKGLGFKVALDDFGKGYSSLNYLKELPVDTIKIDKVFVDNLEDKPSDRRFLEQLITFLNGIEIDIIVEGIETKKQLELVNEMGCNKIQGYYISKPVESIDIERVIEELEA